MTVRTTDLHQWRSGAAARDHAYAAGWRAGLAEAHRLRPHRLRTFAVAVLLTVLVMVGAWALALVLLGVLVTLREHGRRSASWSVAIAVGALYLVGATCVLVALVTLSVLPLLGTVLCFVAVNAEHRSAWSRRLTRWANGHDGRSGPRSGGGPPYRVIYTDKAHHIETRRYADGSEWTVDTLTGEHVPGRF